VLDAGCSLASWAPPSAGLLLIVRQVADEFQTLPSGQGDTQGQYVERSVGRNLPNDWEVLSCGRGRPGSLGSIRIKHQDFRRLRVIRARAYAASSPGNRRQ
jgi:hypothetical protein